MAHLFTQIYVNDIDFEAMTAEKLIGLVLTDIYQLEEATLSKKDETNGNQWTKFRKRFEVLDEEERWIRYAEHALKLLNHDVMLKLAKFSSIWNFQKSTEISLKHSICHVLFGFKCFSETKRTLSINNLIITRKTRHLNPRQKLFWPVVCVVCTCAS